MFFNLWFLQKRMMLIFLLKNVSSLLMDSWISSHKTFNLSDNTKAGTFIGHLPLTEKEALENYQLLFGKGNFRGLVKYFQINNKGEIKTFQLVDRDDEKNICGPLQCCKLSVCEIRFEVIFSPIRTAINLGLKSRTVYVTLHLIDENDNRPVFPRPKYDINIIESFSFSPILLPKAIDYDSTENGIKQYSIDNKYDGLFDIYIVNHSPMLNISREIDYENINQRLFKFILYATDDDTNQYLSKTIVFIHTIDANDNIPKFTFQFKQMDILENISINSTIYQFHAFDNDSNSNSKIDYSMSQLSEPNSVNAKFSLNRESGELKLMKTLDYENFSDRHFKIIVVATDHGNLPLSSSTTFVVKLIDINDHPPEVVIHLNNSVVENEPLGKIVLSVSFTDKDEISKNKLTCEYQKSFGLNIDNIESGIYQISTSQIFDAESDQFCWIQIKCIDSAEPIIEKNFMLNVLIIDLNDNSPRFEEANYYFKVEENIPVGSPVFRVSAIDLDRSDRFHLKYKIINCNIFSIEENSGLVYTKAEIDREEIENFSFTVQVTDTGQLSNQTKVYINVLDVNDNNPKSNTILTFHIPENASLDSLIAELSFFDKDSLENGTISFKEKNDPNYRTFHLSDKGKIKLIRSLDREIQDMYILPFVVYDHGTVISLSTTTSATISILDINDNSPVFIYPSKDVKYGMINPIYFDSPPGTKIVTIKATDGDLNENSKLFFQLESTNATDFIKINSETGEIYFSYEDKPPSPALYEVKIMVTDNGSPKLSSNLRFYMILSEETFPNKQVKHQLFKQRTFFSNIVIFSLIIVFSTALISTLVAVVVWVRSKQNNTFIDSPDLCNYRSMHEDGVNVNEAEVHNINDYNSLKQTNSIKDNRTNETMSPISPDLIFIDHVIQPTTSNWSGTLLSLPQSSCTYKLLSRSYNTLTPHETACIESCHQMCNQSPCIFLQSQSLINNSVNSGESTTRTALLERRYPKFKTSYLDNQC